MQKRTIKKVRYTGKLLKDSKGWALMPRVACETVGECPENAIYLYKRLARVYKYSPVWGKNLAKDSAKGRDFLYSFLNNWLYSELARRGVMTQSQAVYYQKKAGSFGGGAQLKLI